MTRALPLALAAACLFACGTGPAPANADVPGGSVSITPGQAAAYRLYTHCGVRSALINGEVFYASPEINDGSGNPGPGWGNPFDDGQMTLHADGTADFRDSAGHAAHFTSHHASPAPVIFPCA